MPRMLLRTAECRGIAADRGCRRGAAVSCPEAAGVPRLLPGYAQDIPSMPVSDPMSERQLQAVAELLAGNFPVAT